jgi:hypothetical protein
MSELKMNSFTRKVKIIQSLRNELKNKPNNHIAADQKKILEERLHKLNSGNGILKNWSEVRNKYERIG